MSNMQTRTNPEEEQDYGLYELWVQDAERQGTHAVGNKASQVRR